MNDKRNPRNYRRAEDAERAVSQNAQMADAAMALLGCSTVDGVYRVACDCVALVCPGAVVIVNETTPDEQWLVTRCVAGLDASLLAQAAEIFGVEMVGSAWAMLPEYRDEVLSGRLTRLDGGIAALASREAPRVIAAAGAKIFGVHDVFTIGLADGHHALGSIRIITREPHAVLPTHLIESFARHCYSALAGIHRAHELAESAESNRMLLHNMTTGLALHEIILDERGKACDYRFLDVNPAFEMTTGLKADDIVGRTVLEVMPGIEPEWVERYGTVATTGVPVRFEQYAQDLGKYFEISAYSPRAGQFASIIRDITERKRIERVLNERNRFIDAVLENAPIGFAVNTIDDGQTVLISPNFERIYGVETESVGGIEDFFERVYIDPTFREAMRERIMADLASGDPERMRWEDIPITSRTGEVRYVTAINIPVSEQNLMISTVQDVTVLKLAQDEVASQKERIERTLTSVIDIASTIVETRDPYTAGHQRRVAQIATEIARDLGMSEREIADIEVTGLIHDVGKIQVPAEILGKPGGVSPLEFEILKGHAEAGYHIVASANMEEPIAEMVYQHHERCDGSGYPRGLTGKEISRGAKVLAVADVVEAMMSHRPYRPALGIDAALNEIERGSGTLYDADAVRSCLSLFRERGFELTP